MGLECIARSLLTAVNSLRTRIPIGRATRSEDWEGDSLLVESSGLNDRTWLDGGGHPHSEALHVIERFHRRDFGHMELKMTFEDAKVYARPWTISLDIVLVPDTELLEYVCGENAMSPFWSPPIKTGEGSETTPRCLVMSSPSTSAFTKPCALGDRSQYVRRDARRRSALAQGDFPWLFNRKPLSLCFRLMRAMLKSISRRIPEAPSHSFSSRAYWEGRRKRRGEGSRRRAYDDTVAGRAVQPPDTHQISLVHVCCGNRAGAGNRCEPGDIQRD